MFSSMFGNYMKVFVATTFVVANFAIEYVSIQCDDNTLVYHKVC